MLATQRPRRPEWVARLELARGNPAAAEEAVHRALAALTTAGLNLQLVEAFELLAAVSVEVSAPVDAAHLLAGATATRAALGFPARPRKPHRPQPSSRR